MSKRRPYIRHGLKDHPRYQVWINMLERCENPLHKSYPRYGGRGITVCDEWKMLTAFAAWCDQQEWAEGMMLDRVDNDKGYGPNNCRVVTPRENCNNRSSNKVLVAFGESKTIANWARDPRCAIGLSALEWRVRNKKWPTAEQAISEPRRWNYKQARSRQNTQ